MNVKREGARPDASDGGPPLVGESARAARRAWHEWVPGGLVDLRADRSEREPWPADAAILRASLERLGRGEAYKGVLEALLCTLGEGPADSFQLLLKESRGGWAPLLAGRARHALFLGNALSGTVSALVACTGAHVTTMEPCPQRVAFGAHRNRVHVGDRARGLVGGDGARLPFEEGAFDLVVIEEGLPGPGRGGSSGGRSLATDSSGRDRSVSGESRSDEPNADGASSSPFEGMRRKRSETDSSGASGSDSDSNGASLQSAWGFDFDELMRVTRGELVFTVDNRFGYKRSSGRRGRYVVPHPLAWLRGALAPSGGERSLAGYRELVAGFDGRRAFALYPHMRDFTHVVGLDRRGPRSTIGPRLTIGPRERKNWPKLVGERIGLFPHLTPSFCVMGACGEAARRAPLVERVLDELQSETGEERGGLDVLVATRSNTALLQCRPRRERGPAHELAVDGAEAGRWTLHMPLSPRKRDLLEKHHAMLARVRRDFPSVPVPEPLFIGALDEVGAAWGAGSGASADAGAGMGAGVSAGACAGVGTGAGAAAESGDHAPSEREPTPPVDWERPSDAFESGVWLSAERRLPGLTAPHFTGDRERTARMFREAAEHMAQLVVEPERELDDALFDELLTSRFELVARHAGRDETRRYVMKALDELRPRLVGRRLPLVLYHGDLRSKHIQVDRNGRVLGYLDWGASEPLFLPYVDLLHLVAHQRKQEEGCSPRRTWNLIVERTELRPHEAGALALYRERLDLDDEYARAIEAAYPILVAGMAERNWDFSRPLWVHRCFGI